MTTELFQESYQIVSGDINGTFALACNGRPLDLDRHHNVSFNKLTVHYGAVLAAFVCLEKLGFAFLHPLQPYIPPILSISTDDCETYDNGVCIMNITESPHWPERSFHIHTQHPLELTEVLQGHDIPQFGPHGPHCTVFKLSKQGTKSNTTNVRWEKQSKIPYCERWEDMVSDVEKLFQWAVANRLNKIEWLLLGNYKWGDELETRLKRLQVPHSATVLY